MGKWIVLIVGALTLATNYMIFSNRRTTMQAREQQSDYEYQNIAHNGAKSGFDRVVSAIQRDLMAVSDSFPNVSMGDGSYDLAITKNFYGDLDISVDATSGGALYGMEGKVIFAAPMPAAVQLEDEVIDVSGSGTYQISGVDRSMPARAVGGGYLDPARGIMTTYSNREAFTSTLNMERVLGIGSSPDDPVNQSSVEGGFTFTEAEYEELYQEARFNANTTISTTIEGLLRETMLLSAVSSSNAGNPKIVRVQGDLTITSSMQGYGMLIVEDGDLNIVAPDFDWEGLILVRKEYEDTVAVSLQNTTVHGAVIAYDYDPATLLPECIPDFDIIGDQAVVNDSFQVRIKVLGAAITASGTYDVPVTARVDIGGTIYEPWGDYDLPLDGNINTGNSGVTYSWEPDTVFPAGTSIRFDARSWLKNNSSDDGTQNSHWYTYMEASSSSPSSQIQVLEDGSSVPNVGGFMGQYSVEEFLADYIQNDQMVLTANQATNLFELGSTDTGSSAFDMQDAVVLVTMIKAGDSACEAGASTSRLEFSVKDNTSIHYSSEAIAKLGLRLNTIADQTIARVARSSMTGQGEGETLVFEETLPSDDQEDEDENESGSDRVTICHKPKKNGGTTKSVKDKQLAKHLSHGDYVGTCTGWDPDDE